jgi:hypothetical protein
MSEEKLDRFARGELSPDESRELAHKALEDPALFDELTDIAVARTGLKQRPRRRTIWRPVTILAAAAGVIVALLGLNALRSSRPARAPVATNFGPPIFLARTANSGAVFRGPEEPSRPPRVTGAVTSIDDGQVNVDLGALDGLEKGAELEGVRDGKPIGRIKLTTVFRERARAEARPGLKLQVNDTILVPSEMHLRAVLDQIAACAARGDSDGARQIAAQATVAGNLDAVATGHEDWNNLAVIAELRGDRGAAQSLYERALQTGPSPEARRAVESNLARVKGGR